MKSKTIKRCGTCGRFLSEDDFNFRNKKNIHYSYCKRCSSIQSYLYRAFNKENRKKYKKQWCEDNKEHIKKYSKQWNIDNPEYRKQYMKQWRKDNKEYCCEYDKQYRKDNPDKRNVLNAKRRVAKKNQTVLLTDFEKNTVKFIYKVASTMKNFVVDHIQPVSKDGSDHPDNLQILAITLNMKKSDKWPLTEEEKIKYTGFKL